MSLFCTNNSSLINNSLASLLNTCNKLAKFNATFSQDQENNTLSRACGYPSPTNIYVTVSGKNIINPSLPNNLDQTTFYNFWSVTSQVSDLAQYFLDFLNDSNLPGGQADNVYPPMNALVGYLFYFLFCNAEPNKTTLPTIDKNDPYYAVLNNWHYFLANIRGVSSLTTCKLCIDNYIVPSVGDDVGDAGSAARTLMANNIFLRNWCGCCIPQSGSYSYNNKTYNFLNPFINKTNVTDYQLNCEPVCNNVGELSDLSNNSIIIPLITGDAKYVNALVPAPKTLNYDQPICSDTICVISNISVQTVATKGSGIDFNQVCPGCVNDPGKCICYTYGKGAVDKISSGNSGMQDPLVFKQNCPNALCFQEQVDGSYKEVQCNNVNPANTGKSSDHNYNGDGTFNDLNESDLYGVDVWLFPVSILILFIILFLGAIFVTVYRNRVMPRKKHEPGQQNDFSISSNS